MFLDVVMWHVVTFCIGRILQKFSAGLSIERYLHFETSTKPLLDMLPKISSVALHVPQQIRSKPN